MNGQKAKSRKRFKRRHRKILHNNSLTDIKPVLLSSYFGDERRTYSDALSPGLYMIDLNSHGKDTRVKILLSHHYPYPLLPNDDNIKILSIKNDRVLINWDPAKTNDVNPAENLEYCISISSGRHLMSNCLLESQNKDDDEELELDLLPPAASTSFAYWWGKTVKKMLRESKGDNLNGDDNHSIECVGNKLWHMQRLKTDTNYYVGVLAKNSLTNATSMYRILNVTLPDAGPTKLKDNEQITVYLNSGNNYTHSLKYNINAKTKDPLWLFVQSCSGPGPLLVVAKNNIYAENKSHISKVDEVFDMKTMSIPINFNGSQSFLIHLSSEVAAEKSATILISRKQSKFPFPRLPNDRRIKVLDSLTSCDSVTLAFTPSPDEKVLYCIFQLEANNQHSLFLNHKNECIDKYIKIKNHGNSARKVLCRRYHKLSKRRFNNVIVQKVKRLSPGNKYVFQVMITKYRGRTVSYEPVWVSTKPKFHCE